MFLPHVWPPPHHLTHGKQVSSILGRQRPSYSLRFDWLITPWHSYWSWSTQHLLKLVFLSCYRFNLSATLTIEPKDTMQNGKNGCVHWGEHWLVSVTCVNKGVHIPWKNAWRRPPGCYWLLWNTPFDNQSKKSRQVCELSQRNEKMVLELLFGENRVLGHEEVVRPCKYDLNVISTH